ncbi:RDD family protein, partial [bacterium]|nr:RDD family protein [bacterium]
MENNEDIRDVTDLIDVSDVSSRLEDEDFPPLDVEEAEAELKSEKKGLRPLWRRRRQPRGHEPAIADLSDRFAAFILDSIILFYIYWLTASVYNKIFFRDWLTPIKTGEWHGIVLHAGFLLIAFLYYFISEGIFFATPGKALCRMSVKKTNGTTPGIFSVIFRNILRPIDYLFVGFIALFSMEFSWLNQRIGDRLSRTTVVKRPVYLPSMIRLEETTLASATGRTLAFIVDFVIIILLYISYLLLLSPSMRLMSFWLFLFIPIPWILYYIFLEGLTQTTPGKWIFGYSVFFEDGSTPPLSAIIIRTIIRPLDHNPMGVLCIACSSQKQRPGDLAAGTIVCKSPRKLKGLSGFVAAIILISGIAYLGIQNPRNIMTKDFKVNFVPTWEKFVIPDFSFKKSEPVLSEEERDASKDIGIKVTSFKFASNSPDNVRASKIFSPGETVYLVFELRGFQAVNGKVWIQEDLSVNYPDNTNALKTENIIDYNENAEEGTP